MLSDILGKIKNISFELLLKIKIVKIKLIETKLEENNTNG